MDQFGPLGGIEQTNLMSETTTRVFAELESLEHVGRCLERVKQSRGFLQMLKLNEDQLLGNFAQNVVQLRQDELLDLGEPAGIIRSAIMLSHLRSLETHLVERLQPDVLGDLNECYQLPLDAAGNERIKAAVRNKAGKDLEVLLRAWTNMMRTHFPDQQEDTTYNAHRAKDMPVWDLLSYEEHPDDPDFGYLAYMDEESLKYQTDIFAGIVDGVHLCSMGPAFAIVREAAESLSNDEADLGEDN
eukprot:TRINITY_DN54667_c0_g1_i2.p1 TRINITY_DN54667_c0_g1~~TRINITY_DN54667_c0_g1_i2.p1  ORF type:complete len:244 (+),score=48.90 TRINITY_DN54667_c0_g1_i2:326-1057(+)